LLHTGYSNESPESRKRATRHCSPQTTQFSRSSHSSGHFDPEQGCSYSLPESTNLQYIVVPGDSSPEDAADSSLRKNNRTETHGTSPDSDSIYAFPTDLNYDEEAAHLEESREICEVGEEEEEEEQVNDDIEEEFQEIPIENLEEGFTDEDDELIYEWKG